MKGLPLKLVVAIFCALCLLGSRCVVTAASDDNLRIGAFNIQVFGTSKLERSGVRPILVNIVRRYDIILIQEIRDSTGQAIIDLLCAVNNCEMESSIPTYNMTISKRLGRTNSKEQYAFLYRTARVEILSTHQFDDPEDVFQREPYTVFVRSKLEGIPDFFLTGLHAQPDSQNTTVELNALVGVYNLTTGLFRTVNGVLLGDFNADCQYLSNTRYRQLHLFTDARFTWLLDKDVDTTTGNSDCAYDRIIVAGEITNLVSNLSAQVFRFDSVYSLSPELTSSISDHYPVEFQLQSTTVVTTPTDGAVDLKCSQFLSIFMFIFSFYYEVRVTDCYLYCQL